jgi:hypothetical protein
MAPQTATEWRPRPKQRAVLDAAMEVGTERTIVAVCREAQVDRKTFYRWLDIDPGFKAAWEEVWHGSIRRHLPGVISAMVDRAQSGDVQAARLLADIYGLTKQKIEITITRTERIEQVMEALKCDREEAERAVAEAERVLASR